MAKWPEKDTEDRRNAPFKSTWANTLDLLAFELDKLSARHVTLSTMHSPHDVRLDGKLRGDSTNPKHPGVILTFEKLRGLDDEGSDQNMSSCACRVTRSVIGKTTCARSRWRSRPCEKLIATACALVLSMPALRRCRLVTSLLK
jgi:hypothetical protein